MPETPSHNFPRATEQAHRWIAQRIRPGDTVIDATAGNGHDTAFLAGLVGESGHVFAIDVQQTALEATAKKLHVGDFRAKTQLILDGHENLANHVAEPVRAVTFNLGYLPGSDKTVKTRPETTIAALVAVLGLLLPGGIVTLVLYTGHGGGREEADAVVAFCRKLDAAKFRVMRYEALNSRKEAPFLVAIERAETTGNS